MKVKVIEAKPDFTPIKIELTVESLEELKMVRLRFAPSLYHFKKIEEDIGLHDTRTTVEEHLRLTLDNIRDLMI